jgi:hypothetical protein
MKKIEILAGSLKPRARVITLRPFSCAEHFKTIHTLRVKMSWGKSSVIIYQKN